MSRELPELASTAKLLMECDALGALGEASQYLPGATYARLHSAIYTLAEEAVRLEREACAKAADDVDEPGWTGYECPNTFNDGKWAAAAAIRARSQEGQG
jgi:hypothetical protein